jgi:putative two-component system response regulator
MLDRNPARRPASPQAGMNAQTPLQVQDAPALLATGEVPPAAPDRHGAEALPAAGGPAPRRRALIVDDSATYRMRLRGILQPAGWECAEVGDGASALAAAAGQSFDLVLLDLNLPDIDGYEVCRRLREPGNDPHLKVIVVSGAGDVNALSESLPRGADDYLCKPFEARQLAAKVDHALRLKEAQDRARLLAGQLLLTNRQLEQSLEARAADVRQAQDALLFTAAKMAEDCDGETPSHLRRLQGYARALALEVAPNPDWAGLVDDRFLEQLERCVPLHDIGKVGLPDGVLLKPAALSAAERALVETHPLIGDRLLETLGREHGTSLEFIGMARAIVRHHHERFDGEGYPDRLAGDDIPAAARLVALADAYDALRRRRPYKAALGHAEAVRVILEDSPGQFDPSLLVAFSACQAQFERIYRDVAE